MSRRTKKEISRHLLMKKGYSALCVGVLSVPARVVRGEYALYETLLAGTKQQNFFGETYPILL